MRPEGKPPAMVRVEAAGGVATVTMLDSSRRNVLSPDMVAGLLDAYDHIEADATVRAVVLAAEGRAFCAGAELAVLESSAAGDPAGVELVYRAFLRVRESPLPTIGVINGPAVGAGLNLALACDLRLATPRARFDSRFLTLRLIPGGGHTWMLERAVGQQVATAMVVFGETLDADAAVASGLVYQVLPDDASALAEAQRLASNLAEVERDFTVALTSIVRRSPRLPSHEDALDLERYTQRWSTSRPSFLDGVSAMRAAVENRTSS